MKRLKKETVMLLLNHYKDTNINVPALFYPFILEMNSKTYWCATNRYRFILISNFPEYFYAQDCPGKQPKLEDLLPKSFEIESNVNIFKLRNSYNKIELIEKSITFECPLCEGNGNFDYGEHNYKCKDCMGTGTYISKDTTQVKDTSVYFTYNDKSRIPNEFINEILNVIEQTETNTLNILKNTNESLLLFSLDEEIIIGIATKRIYDDDDELNGEIKTIKIPLIEGK